MTAKVLQLIGTLEQGGTERQAVQLTRLLIERDCRVSVACLDPNGPLRGELEALGLKVAAFPLTSFHDALAARQLYRFARLLRTQRIDVLHTHDLYSNVFGMAAGALAGVPVRIASRRSMNARRTWLQKEAEKVSFRLAYAIVANADAIRSELICDGVPAQKVVTIYNGLDAERTRPSPGGRMRWLAELGLHAAPELRYVSILANLRLPVKDIPVFLRAARSVAEAVPNTRFLLAGEGELSSQLRALAAELGLDGKVQFLGRCQRVAELLAVSDVCVLSSLSEGFSNSVLEYMAAGRPVVVTDVGGAREAVIDKYSGYLVPPGDHDRMAARIVDLLRDPGRARQMGERGRRIVERSFSCARQVEQTCSLYERLLRPLASKAA